MRYRLLWNQHFIYVERRAKIFTNGDNGSTDDYVYSDLVDPAQGYRFTDSIVVTPYGLEIVRTSPNEGQTVGRLESVRTIKEDEAGNPLRFLGAHTNPVVFSHDGTLAFIAGKRGSGKIYVLDTQSLSIVHTIELRNRPENISAMIMHDSWLYIAETGKNGRLIRLMANPLENGYLETEQVIRSNHIAGLEHGIGDLALSDNRYLGMVAAREEVRVFNQFGHSQVAKGDVYILDLEKINSEGIMDSGVLHLDAGFFETHDRGRSPDQIIAGLQPGEFLVSYASDRNKGVSGIRAELASGSFDLTGKAKLVSTSLYPDNDKDRYMRLMRQNVQRASDMVLAVLDNMLYAFVSDYAFKFNDPSWTEESKFGAGRQIGGKIAVIRDPFGYHGQPQYIGSTSAIEGAAIRHLSMTADGKLLANAWFNDEYRPQEGIWRSAHSLMVWDAAALLTRAEEDFASGAWNQSKPIDRPAIPGLIAQNGVPATPQKQIPALIPGRYETANGTDALGWIYGIENHDAQINDIRVLRRKEGITLPEIQTPETMVDVYEEFKLDRNDSFAILNKRLELQGRISLRTMLAAQKRKLGLDISEDIRQIKLMHLKFSQLNYDGDGKDGSLSRNVAGLVEFIDENALGMYDIAMTLLDMDARIKQTIPIVFKDLWEDGDLDQDPFVTAVRDDPLYFSNVGRDYMFHQDPQRLFNETGNTLKSLNPVTGIWEVGHEFGSSVSDGAFLSDPKRATKASLELLTLGIGFKTARGKIHTDRAALARMAEHGEVGKVAAIRERLAITRQQISSDVVQAAMAARKTAHAVKHTVERGGRWAVEKGRYAYRSLTDRMGPAVSKFHIEGTAYSTKFKTFFSGPTPHKIDLATAVNHAFEDGVFSAYREQGGLIEGWDFDPITRLTDTKIVEKLSPELRDKVGNNVVMTAFTDARGVKKQLIINVLDESQNLPLQSGQLSARSAASYVFDHHSHNDMVTYKNAWDNGDPVVIHLRADTLNNRYAFDNALYQELDELRRLSEHLREKGSIPLAALEKEMAAFDKLSRDQADARTLELLERDGLLDMSDPDKPAVLLEDGTRIDIDKEWWRGLNEMSKAHETDVTARLQARYGADKVFSQVPYRVIDNETGKPVQRNGKDLEGIADNIVILEENGTVRLQMVEAKSTWAHKDALNGLKDRPFAPDQDALNPNFNYRQLFNANQQEIYSKLTSGKYKIQINKDHRVMIELNKLNTEKRPAFGNHGLPNLEPDLRLEVRVYGSKAEAQQGRPSADWPDRALTLGHDRLNRPILAVFGAGGSLLYTDAEAAFPALLEAAKTYWRQWGIPPERLADIRLTFKELPEGRAAQTDGEHTISLSPDAAGQGWFVDTTPLLHEEYAMNGHHGTADSGNAARGLDALTVLIHELGHILGLNDNRMVHNIMNERLPQGVRRLPSAQDAAALGFRLRDDSAFQGETHQINTPLKQDGIRHPNWQAVSPRAVFASLTDALAPEIWRQSGKAVFENGGVWLYEASDAQTRIAQAFRLNAKQKVLGFTLHDGHISDNGGTQASDAFEAALLDAATGKPLFTGGLDRSDSLLNIQADGGETLAPSIRRIYNPDGSRSYYLDLSAYLAAQTAAGREAAVWLGFDLLGFSNADSKIRISGITLSETMPDQPIQIDPAAPKPSENTGSSTVTPKPSDNAHGGHGTTLRPSENTGGSTVTPKPSDNAHGGHGTTLRPSENTGGSTATPKPSDNAHGGHGTTLRPSENTGGSTVMPKPSDNAHGGHGTTPMPSENTNSHTGQPSLPDTPQPETWDEGPTETPATAFDVSDGLRIARDILLLLNPDDAAGTGGTWLWEQPVSVGEGKNYTLGFDYQARIDEPVLLKIYQGSRLIRQSRIDGGISGRFDLPLAGSGHTDFIRIYAERAAVSAAHAIMPSEKPAARLSVSQRLGWFLLAAALLLTMIAQYQGYPLLPARRRRQVILSGLPAGSTLGDGSHSFTATDERREADIGDWDAGSLRLDLGGIPAAETRLLLTVTTPRFGLSREIRRYAFVLDEQGGCEIWHNGALLAASGKRTAETSDGQIRLDLSAIVKNRLQNDETWMRRAEKRLAQSWQLFKKQ